MRALLRRSGAVEPTKNPASILESGPLRLETEGRLAYKDGKEVELTVREFDLMELHAQLVALGGSYARMDRIQASAAGGIA